MDRLILMIHNLCYITRYNNLCIDRVATAVEAQSVATTIIVLSDHLCKYFVLVQ